MRDMVKYIFESRRKKRQKEHLALKWLIKLIKFSLESKKSTKKSLLRDWTH